jgi:phage-related protein
VGEPKTVKKISVSFFQNDKGKMPVREWILGFSPDDKKIIGEDIKTAEFGWPVGMPVVKPIGDKLYEVRSSLSDGSEARILFTIYKNYMLLLHGFIKKTQKIQKRELNLARNRMKKFFKSEKFK